MRRYASVNLSAETQSASCKRNYARVETVHQQKLFSSWGSLSSMKTSFFLFVCTPKELGLEGHLCVFNLIQG